MEREVIDLLKDQMRMKDTQIADLSEQNKAPNNLHLKLTGQIVQQTERIQNSIRYCYLRYSTNTNVPR
jgi:hypothetical protein